MLLRKKDPDRVLYDFAMIIGSCTEDAQDMGAIWDKFNIADASDKGVQELAKTFIEYHKELLEKPNMAGLLEPNASLANFRALELARDSTNRNKVLTSNLSHASIERACHSLKLEPIVLDVDPEQGYQIDKEVLARAISKHGNDIAAVVSTYGTTQLGHIENIARAKSVRQLRKDGAWLHVDAAYGGYVGSLSYHNQEKVPDADSITIDPYKFIGKPGVALLLVNQNELPKSEVPYYSQSPHTIHTTLSAGPIAAWFYTKEEVGSSIRETAVDCCKIAYFAGKEVENKGGQLVNPVKLSITPIAIQSAEERDFIHRELLKEHIGVGKIHITGRDYEVNGLRLVVTPKVNTERQYHPAHQAARMITELMR